MASYDEVYLQSAYDIHEYLFHMFIDSGYDFFECINAYMNGHERQLMDMGNPLALNLTPKQLLNRMDKKGISKADNEEIDPFISNWIADMLVYLQWFYEISSKEIVEKLDVKKLYQMYSPLHEASISNGAAKLYNNFFNNGDK